MVLPAGRQEATETDMLTVSSSASGDAMPHRFAPRREKGGGRGGDGAVEQERGCREKAFLNTIPNSKVTKLLCCTMEHCEYSVGLAEVLPCLNTGGGEEAFAV